MSLGKKTFLHLRLESALKSWSCSNKQMWVSALNSGPNKKLLKSTYEIRETDDYKVKSQSMPVMVYILLTF